MTQIRCKHCVNQVIIFDSLLIDPGKACDEVMLQLSEHIKRYHPEALTKLAEIMNMLPLLLVGYLPIVYFGSFDCNNIVSTENNNLKIYNQMCLQKISELITGGGTKLTVSSSPPIDTKS